MAKVELRMTALGREWEETMQEAIVAFGSVAVIVIVVAVHRARMNRRRRRPPR